MVWAYRSLRYPCDFEGFIFWNPLSILWLYTLSVDELRICGIVHFDAPMANQLVDTFRGAT